MPLMFCSVAQVREKNLLLHDRTYDWIQARVVEQTRYIIRKLRGAFPAQLKDTAWLANPPASVPDDLQDICIQLSVGQCIKDAYANDGEIVRVGYAEQETAVASLNDLILNPILLDSTGAAIVGAEHVVGVGEASKIDTDLIKELERYE